jgi:hypothetical protein
VNSLVTTQGPFKNEDERQTFLTAIPIAVPIAETLADVQRSQLALLSAKCQETIYAGFTSSALGTPYTYPAKDRDQNNLNASVTASLLPGLLVSWTTPFPCMDANGVWAHRMHTAAQIQQVGLDAKAAIVTCVLKNQSLAQQVMVVIDISAAGIAQVKGIVW